MSERVRKTRYRQNKLIKQAECEILGHQYNYLDWGTCKHCGDRKFMDMNNFTLKSRQMGMSTLAPTLLAHKLQGKPKP